MHSTKLFTILSYAALAVNACVTSSASTSVSSPSSSSSASTASTSTSASTDSGPLGARSVDDAGISSALTGVTQAPASVTLTTSITLHHNARITLVARDDSDDDGNSGDTDDDDGDGDSGSGDSSSSGDDSGSSESVSKTKTSGYAAGSSLSFSGSGSGSGSEPTGTCKSKESFESGSGSEDDESSSKGTSSTFTSAPGAPGSSQSQSSGESSPTTSSGSSISSSAATSNSSSSSGNGQVYTDAFATFYTQDGNAGACGDTHSDSDLIGAIDKYWYGDYNGEKTSALCGVQVHIKNTNNNKEVTITIADVCPTCDTDNSIDLSVGAFTSIATEEEGEVPIEWYFLDGKDHTPGA